MKRIGTMFTDSLKSFPLGVLGALAVLKRLLLRTEKWSAYYGIVPTHHSDAIVQPCTASVADRTSDLSLRHASSTPGQGTGSWRAAEIADEVNIRLNRLHTAGVERRKRL